MIKVGSDFSGVGAFNQALQRLGIDYEEVFACDMDKYARQTFCLNFGEPKYYPENVYDREIPKESLDIYMTSPPCQAFSLAGKRLGKEDKRGILFFNSLEFIQENKPRYFIFENVKGLLSHDKKDKEAEYGRTFQEWINHLGGKSVNGNETIFPYEDSVPYHIYFQVLNAKNYGIPQNRERVFIIGIRDDADNNFQFPKPYPLEKRLKDVLESEVDEKYFLSDKMVNVLNHHQNKITIENDNPEQSATIHAGYFKMGGRDQQYVKAARVIGRNPENPKSREPGLPTEQILEINEDFNVTNTLTTVQKDNVILVPTNNSKGFDTAEEEEEDSINFSNPNSETRRGRVGKKVSQTLDTSCNQGILTGNLFNTDKNINFDGILKSIDNEKRNTAKVLLMLQQEIGKTAIETWGLRIMEVIREEVVLRQKLHEESLFKQGEKKSKRNNNKNKQVESAKIIAKIIMRSLPKEGWERCSSQRRKSIKQLIRQLNESLSWLSYENPSSETNLQIRKLQFENERVGLLQQTLCKIQEIWESINVQRKPTFSSSRIRRLTPTEAFRLMDFNFGIPNVKDFVWNVSDSQAYKQAGNSICVGVLVEIIKKLNL